MSESVDNFNQGVLNFLNGFWDTLKGLFVPSEDYWERGGLNTLKTALENKFDFIYGIRDALQLMANTQGQSLNYEFTLLGHKYHINFDWYEPHRLGIRHSIGIIFYAIALLKQFKVVLKTMGLETSNDFIGNDRDMGGHGD